MVVRLRLIDVLMLLWVHESLFWEIPGVQIFLFLRVAWVSACVILKHI